MKGNMTSMEFMLHQKFVDLLNDMADEGTAIFNDGEREDIEIADRLLDLVKRYPLSAESGTRREAAVAAFPGIRGQNEDEAELERRLVEDLFVDLEITEGETGRLG